MTARPITFSTEMIHALMAGRKHVTRRLVSPQPPANAAYWIESRADESMGSFVTDGLQPIVAINCPYGPVGTTLRVREAAWMWCEKVADGLTPKGRPKFRYVPVQHTEANYQTVFYQADHPERPDGKPTDHHRDGKVFVWRLKIPRYLPSWASRTTLKVESIRCERLGEITEDDAIAEGIERVTSIGPCRAMGWKNYLDRMPDFCHTAVESFKSLWESIHGPDSWQREREKWVWVVGFSKLDGTAAPL